MNGDILPPPKRPEHSLQPAEPSTTTIPPRVESQPIIDEPPQPKPRRWKRIIIITIVTLLVAIVLAVLAGWAWVRFQLTAVSPGSSEMVLVKIVPGTDVEGIADELHEAGVIRDPSLFEWYVRWEKVADNLQAGTYRISKASNVPEIVDILTSGKTETMTITFFPGNTLAKHREVLEKAGYEKSEIDIAFKKQYDHPLFASKPASADLEGYIYGETYQFPADATVEDILLRTFDEFYKVVESEKLVATYKKRGLTLYEGITLASIIQREVPTSTDQKQVSQVFHLRLKRDMQLGSDVTYQYIADKTGVPRDPNLNSPYNTRRFEGLPPGPIASPGKSALIATGKPAKGNYLYFLSGDDDKTYFARTNEGHERNIVEHCQKKCQIL